MARRDFPCSALALHGVKCRDRKALLHAILDWMRFHECPPDLLGIGTSGVEGRVTSFATAMKKAESLPSKAILDWTLYSKGSRYKNVLQGYRMSSVASFSETHCLILVADASVLPVTALANDVETRLLPHFTCDYGIGYTMPFAKGPDLFALGIQQGDGASSGPEYEQARLEAHWGIEGLDYEVYSQGILRDVYPINLLNPSQLTASVGGASLRAWIEAVPQRGILRPFGKTLFEWRIQAGQIPKVRERLEEVELLFSFDTEIRKPKTKRKR